MAVTLRQSFEHQLRELRLEVLRMGTHAVEMLDMALQALYRHDVGLARKVINLDDAVDEMDLQIEQTCMRLLALQQPMSKDLRIIGTALKMIADIERIGDFSVDIAKTARRMADEPYFPPLAPIQQMGECTMALVREALQSYVDHDLARVHRAVDMDDEVDAWYDRIFTDLLAMVERDPAVFRQATWFTHIIHFLERIADHAVNVAERVYYMETGDFRQLAKSHKSEGPGPV